MFRGVSTVGAALVLAMLVALAGCGTKEGSPTSGASTPASTSGLSPSPSANAMQRAVHADALQMKADIEAASARGVAVPSNPYEAVGFTHTFDRLVARGPAALDAIATEIETMPNDDLYAYMLAIAAEQIPGGGDWEIKSGKEWAAQYRSSK